MQKISILMSYNLQMVVLIERKGQVYISQVYFKCFKCFYNIMHSSTSLSINLHCFFHIFTISHILRFSSYKSVLGTECFGCDKTIYFELSFLKNASNLRPFYILILQHLSKFLTIILC